MIYENEWIYIEKEESQVPWIKIFTKQIYKEFSDCPCELQKELFDKILRCEKAMIEFYKPEKINIASFANYVPRVHFHIMARFKEDAFFPECMWGKQQREFKDLNLPSFDEFVTLLKNKMEYNYH
ncbi:TPA: HIT family protein [Campylobacter coli]|nr:HIT family protein [Campylobacter coli]HEA7842455.1 HIT family protein [Campylobacter coli]HEH4645294.1 HIT family protein [Campylobacter coli]HEH4982165.1 HIT family protein [Campylobacter coli]HEH5120068.1 HIT family protein [Campylobacter coli]